MAAHGQSPLGKGPKEMCRSGCSGPPESEGGRGGTLKSWMQEIWGQASYPTKGRPCKRVYPWLPGLLAAVGSWGGQRPQGQLEACIVLVTSSARSPFPKWEGNPCPGAMSQGPKFHPHVTGARAQANPAQTKLGTHVMGSPGPPPWSRARSVQWCAGSHGHGPI